jgi:hypothetical protein
MTKFSFNILEECAKPADDIASFLKKLLSTNKHVRTIELENASTIDNMRDAFEIGKGFENITFLQFADRVVALMHNNRNIEHEIHNAIVTDKSLAHEWASLVS